MERPPAAPAARPLRAASLGYFDPVNESQPPPRAQQPLTPPPRAQAPPAPAAARPPAAPPPQVSELGGMRAWLAELDRLLGVRTRVGLVLLAIAIGLAAAAAWLALDTRDDAASSKEVAELRSRVEALEAQGGGGAGTTGLPARVTAAESAAREARAEVARLRARIAALEGQAAGAAGGGGRAAGTGSGGAPRSGSGDAAGGTGSSGAGGGVAPPGSGTKP